MDNTAEKGEKGMQLKGGENDLEDNQPTTYWEMWKAWPKVTFLTIANEFCERFSYYGLRAVLALYFINVSGFSQQGAKTTVQVFQMMAYATAVIGSILADGFIGRYRTIAIVSIIYACGQILLTFSAIQSPGGFAHPGIDFIALLIIAFGTGGIKPVVATFGADQFKTEHKKMLSMFFSVFYFSINAGSVISSYVTPAIRMMPCLGATTCFAGAFGLPAVLMIVATVFFFLGSKWYKRMPLTENAIARVFSIFFFSLKNYFSSQKRKEHVFDHACDNHRCDKDRMCQILRETDPGACQQKIVAEDCKDVVRILVMFIPIIFFWACFDQQSTSWTLQGLEMELRTGWSFKPVILPDQMTTVNAFLILFFIPLFQIVLYPLMNKCFKLTVLRKIGIGLFLCACAFVACATLQLYLNDYENPEPTDGKAYLSVSNMNADCDVTVDVDGQSAVVKPNSFLRQNRVSKTLEWITLKNGGSKSISVSRSGASCANAGVTKLMANITPKKVNVLTLTPTGWLIGTTTVKKSEEAKALSTLEVTSLLRCPKGATSCPVDSVYNGTLALCRTGKSCDSGDKEHFYSIIPKAQVSLTSYGNDALTDGFTYLEPRPGKEGPLEMLPGSYQLYYSTDGKEVEVPGAVVNIEGTGGVQQLVLVPRPNENVALHLNQIVPFNAVHILWQLPQYIILTASEVMVSISLLEFAYTEASPRLKSFIAACNLLTVAAGNLLVIITTNLLSLFTSSKSTEMYVFAAATFAATALWTWLAAFYYKLKDVEKVHDSTTTTNKPSNDDWNSVDLSTNNKSQ